MPDAWKSCVTRVHSQFQRLRALPIVIRQHTLVGTYAAPLTFCLALAAFCVTADVGFRIADDGYLWYGAQRVLAGEVPLRDFYSYDPARYYWTAAVMAVLHSRGFVAVNIAAALFGAIGLGIAARLIFHGQQRVRWGVWLLVAISLVIWGFTRAKLFDVTASVILVASLAWLIEKPTRYRCFMTGLGVGAVAIIGRNHGLYGAIASILALGCSAWPERKAPFLPSLLSWSGGVVVGYTPMLLAIAFVPGFWTYLWAGIHVYFETGTTNSPLPIPWPWLVHLKGGQVLPALRYVLEGALLMALPLFGLAVLAFSVWRKSRYRVPADSLLLAAGLLSIPYAHHAFAHAGPGHLAQAAYPMLIGVFVLLSRLPRRRAAVLAAVVCALSIFLLAPSTSEFQKWRSGNWTNIKVGPDTLVLPPSTGAEVTVVTRLIDRYVPAGREIVAVPMLTGAYAIADCRAAVWDVYAAYPADAALQQAEIARIRSEHPALVIIADKGPDDRAALSYQQGHPLVYDFIAHNFVRANPGFVPEDWHWEVYIPAGAGG